MSKQERDPERGLTCVQAECALSVGGCVADVGLAKGSNEGAGGILRPPLLQELRCRALVVPADEGVGVVDGCAVHRKPGERASAPATMHLEQLSHCLISTSPHTVYHFFYNSASSPFCLVASSQDLVDHNSAKLWPK